MDARDEATSTVGLPTQAVKVNYFTDFTVSSVEIGLPSKTICARLHLASSLLIRHPDPCGTCGRRASVLNTHARDASPHLDDRFDGNLIRGIREIRVL
jgi:hypothetical protein